MEVQFSHHQKLMWHFCYYSLSLLVPQTSPGLIAEQCSIMANRGLLVVLFLVLVLALVIMAKRDLTRDTDGDGLR